MYLGKESELAGKSRVKFAPRAKRECKTRNFVLAEVRPSRPGMRKNRMCTKGRERWLQNLASLGVQISREISQSLHFLSLGT